MVKGIPEVLMIAALIVTIAPSFAAPLNAWGGAQARHTAAAYSLNYDALDGTVSHRLYGGLGLANGDVWTGVGVVGSVADESGLRYAFDIMPRWFPTDSFALSPHILYTQGDAQTVVGLEAHHVARIGAFALTTNVAWLPRVGAGGFDVGDLALLAGPEVFVTERVSFSAEVDVTASASVGVADSTAATVSPAVCAALTADGTHTAALGAVLPVWPGQGSPMIGTWYSLAFSTVGHSASAADSE